MKLTQTIRQDFLNKVLASIKARDYADEAENIWMKIIITQMPNDVAEIYASVNTKWVSTDEIARIRRDMRDKRARNSPLPVGVANLFKELEAVEADREKHNYVVSNIRDSITTASLSVTTVNGLGNLFPQYRKWLPSDGVRPSKEAAAKAVAHINFGIKNLEEKPPVVDAYVITKPARRKTKAKAKKVTI